MIRSIANRIFLLQILDTRPGERLMNPEFGSRLNELVFEQNDEVLKGMIRHYVIDAIKQWEKRIAIVNVFFDKSSDKIDSNILLICISYWVIQSQTEGNLIYPFFRDLGAPSNFQG